MIDRVFNVFASLLLICIAAVAQSSSAAELTISHLAGNTTGAGYANGTGSAARFSGPSGVAVDADGNAYVADTSNHVIRKITPAGVVTTFAGMIGLSGANDGAGSAARFNAPEGIAIDASGTLYITDTGNYTVRKMTLAGVVTTFAGQTGVSGVWDATGTAAVFSSPVAIAVDAAAIYIADYNACVIRRISPSGVVTTLAGVAYSCGEVDGTGTSAQFLYPRAIAAGSGNVYVADQWGHTIRKIAPGGVVTTLAGLANAPGGQNGQGAAASFQQPGGIAVAASGDIYVADSSRIRKTTATGLVTSFVGGSEGSADGSASSAQFSADPKGLAFDSTGNLYVAEKRNHSVRKVTPTAVVTTIAGTAPSWGAVDGTGSDALLNGPSSIAVDTTGSAYFSDNDAIRKVTSTGVVTTFAGLLGARGTSDGTAANARFSFPDGVAIDSAGTLYVADRYSHTIRKISGGTVTTMAGSAGQKGSADGVASAARFDAPRGIAVDAMGNVYVADYYKHTIRKITPAGVVSTFAGQAGGYGHADGTGSAAMFRSPLGVAVDSLGNVYVADTFNYVIRKISPAGTVSTLAGTVRSPGAVDGVGNAAQFMSLSRLTVDPSGNVFVADSGAIRKVTSGGVVSTILGVPGSPGNVNGTGSAARVSDEFDIAIDAIGTLHIADTWNNAIRVAAFALVAGDVNGDGDVNTSDIFHLINVLYGDWPATAGADVNGDGFVTISDVFFLINFLFGAGPAPSLSSPDASLATYAAVGDDSPSHPDATGRER